MASDNASSKSPDEQPKKDWSYFTSTYPHVVGNVEYFGEAWRKLVLKVFVENEDSLKTINEKLNEVELLSPQTIEIVWAFTKFTTPPDEVHTIIIGQDPSPNAKSGDGLAFSIRDDFKHPELLSTMKWTTKTGGIPSKSALQTIVFDIKDSFKDCVGNIKPKFDEENCCSLKNWAKQGVLLMNTCLTRTNGKGEENEHFDIGWEKIVGSLIVKVIQEVKTNQKRGVVIIAMGTPAYNLYRKHLEKELNNNNEGTLKNLFLESPHPCAEARQAGQDNIFTDTKFIGTHNFRKAYDFLKTQSGITVDWSIIYNSTEKDKNISELLNMAPKHEKKSKKQVHKNSKGQSDKNSKIPKNDDVTDIE